MSKDSEFAFPKGQSDYTENRGMTLRDYFAAKAIPSGLNVSSHDAANLVGRECPLDSAGKIQWLADVHSAICYIMADAMLLERAK